MHVHFTSRSYWERSTIVGRVPENIFDVFYSMARSCMGVTKHDEKASD